MNAWAKSGCAFCFVSSPGTSSLGMSVFLLLINSSLLGVWRQYKISKDFQLKRTRFKHNAHHCIEHNARLNGRLGQNSDVAGSLAIILLTFKGLEELSVDSTSAGKVTGRRVCSRSCGSLMKSRTGYRTDCFMYFEQCFSLSLSIFAQVRRPCLFPRLH